MIAFALFFALTLILFNTDMSDTAIQFEGQTEDVVFVRAVAYNE